MTLKQKCSLLVISEDNVLNCSMTKEELLDRACEIFEVRIFRNLIDRSLDKASRIDEYNVNPFIIKYLANFGFGSASPENIAKALILPRILGSSISTSFGANVQNMIIEIFPNVQGSVGSGLDIEFHDQVDNRYKYCQLKAGPNTINSGDVEPIISKLKSGYRLLRTNGNKTVVPDDLCVGVLYGEFKFLSQHYLNVHAENPVYVGSDIWHRISGYKTFYNDLIQRLEVLADTHNAQQELDDATTRLASEIRALKIV